MQRFFCIPEKGRAIEDACDSPEEVREELRITLMHEIAHFFGMDDDELEEAGY